MNNQFIYLSPDLAKQITENEIARLTELLNDAGCQDLVKKAEDSAKEMYDKVKKIDAEKRNPSSKRI